MLSPSPSQTQTLIAHLSRTQRRALQSLAFLLVIGFLLVSGLTGLERRTLEMHRDMLETATKLQSVSTLAIEALMDGDHEERIAVAESMAGIIAEFEDTAARIDERLKYWPDGLPGNLLHVRDLRNLGPETLTAMHAFDSRLYTHLMELRPDIGVDTLTDLNTFLELQLISRLTYMANLHRQNHQTFDVLLSVTKLIVLGLQLAVLGGFAFFVFAPMHRKVGEASAQSEARLDEAMREAFFDAETGLANRNMLRSTLSLPREAEEAQGLTLLALSVQQKSSLGDAGSVLSVTADRLAALSVGAEVTVRLDELRFALLFLGEFRGASLDKLVVQLRKTLARPVTQKGVPIQLGVKIGVAFGTACPSDDQDLLREAELAMERDEGAAPSIFVPAMLKSVQDAQDRAQDLARGLKQGEVISFFQPQVDIADHSIAGFEALIRWNHPTKGLLSPFHFLDIAAAAGLSEELGEVTIISGLKAFRTWQQAGFAVQSIGLNFSAEQIASDRLLDLLDWECDRLEVDPACVNVEVLEDVLTEDANSAVLRNLKRIAQKGYRIDLDDFGTGFASLSNIERFGAHRIKIDRSFIADIEENASHRSLVVAMVGMAEGLNIGTLVEGVETQAIVDCVSALGGRVFQGYHFGKPMGLEETLRWLDRWHAEHGTITQQPPPKGDLGAPAAGLAKPQMG
ncbi:MAG: GGDEF domain-containing phosphodiesterase [Pseudomonadota bacterium]